MIPCEVHEREEAGLEIRSASLATDPTGDDFLLLDPGTTTGQDKPPTEVRVPRRSMMTPAPTGYRE